ncbi:hypothetical protein OB925_02410 [Aeromonas rivipollensis]|uniref:hypothetical protein n=1 Tax=Aeromonas rivipollensis TaxID=948519 RepID=UPI00259D6F67|nr:hypothetical protein [Aeromonas rivipollensis]MDM5083716.1 hypothetical protein [Aeromonas rivipollensis]MDM5096094.1 hypothetical protein [Aeromonas rivipollensis]MDM5104353.1 hypothetical protein [Aeromonas rivipollensis]
MTCTKKDKSDWLVIIISIISLLLSIASIVYTHKQTNIDKVNAIPLIYVEEHSLLGRDGYSAVQKTLSVYNEGGGLKNIEGNICSIVNISYKNKKGEIKNISIHLLDYYIAQSKSSKPTGNVISFYGHDNNLKYTDIDNEFINLRYERNQTPVIMDLKNILTLSYKDRFDEKHTMYFTNTQEDTEDNVTPYLSICKIDGDRKHRYSLSNLTPSIITKIIENDDT